MEKTVGHSQVSIIPELPGTEVEENGAGFPRAPLRTGCDTSLLYAQHISLHCVLQIDFNKPDFNYQPTAGFTLPQRLYSLVLSLCKYMCTHLYL